MTGLSSGGLSTTGVLTTGVLTTGALTTNGFSAAGVWAGFSAAGVWAGLVATLRLLPQLRQNFASVATGCPHPGHGNVDACAEAFGGASAAREAPHARQNFFPDGWSTPHAGQAGMIYPQFRVGRDASLIHPTVELPLEFFYLLFSPVQECSSVNSGSEG